MQEAVDEANAKLARVEQIKKFTLVAGDWLPGGDELTPTMKLKRKPIAAKYAAEIEAMYVTVDRARTLRPAAQCRRGRPERTWVSRRRGQCGLPVGRRFALPIRAGAYPLD